MFLRTKQEIKNNFMNTSTIAFFKVLPVRNFKLFLVKQDVKP